MESRMMDSEIGEASIKKTCKGEPSPSTITLRFIYEKIKVNEVTCSIPSSMSKGTLVL